MIPKRPGGGRGMITLHIKDKEMLFKCYLPFLKNGGLFYPTDKPYRLGDEVFMLVTLISDNDKIPVAGKVAWINPPRAQGNRPAGIGVHFGDQDKGETRSKIETMLVGMLAADRPTFTM